MLQHVYIAGLVTVADNLLENTRPKREAVLDIVLLSNYTVVPLLWKDTYPCLCKIIYETDSGKSGKSVIERY